MGISPAKLLLFGVKGKDGMGNGEGSNQKAEYRKRNAEIGKRSRGARRISPRQPVAKERDAALIGPS